MRKRQPRAAWRKPTATGAWGAAACVPLGVQVPPDKGAGTASSPSSSSATGTRRRRSVHRRGREVCGRLASRRRRPRPPTAWTRRWCGRCSWRRMMRCAPLEGSCTCTCTLRWRCWTRARRIWWQCVRPQRVSTAHARNPPHRVSTQGLLSKKAFTEAFLRLAALAGGPSSAGDRAVAVNLLHTVFAEFDQSVPAPAGGRAPLSRLTPVVGRRRRIRGHEGPAERTRGAVRGIERGEGGARAPTDAVAAAPWSSARPLSSRAAQAEAVLTLFGASEDGAISAKDFYQFLCNAYRVLLRITPGMRDTAKTDCKGLAERGSRLLAKRVDRPCVFAPPASQCRLLTRPLTATVTKSTWRSCATGSAGSERA